MTPRILFTTIYDPEPILDRWASTDQMAYRLTRQQGIFTLSEHAHSWPLHILAQNVEAASVVLEWPSLDEFEQELTDHDYDYVCISFMSRDLDKLPEMSAAVRRLRPHAKIVIGGYGVICVPDKKADQYATDYDFICRIEGIQFLRQLLGQFKARPVLCHLPQIGVTLPWLTRRSRGHVGAALASLGCTQRCPFCTTSFFTKGRRIEVLDVQALYETMLYYQTVNPFTSSVNIYDENFLDYKEIVDALGHLIREDPRYGLRQLNYFTFGSMSAIAKYDPEELLLNGLDTVWIGVESYFTRLKKTRPDEDVRHHLNANEHGAFTAQTFRSLHGIGIKTVGSWIIGLDCQDRMNIAHDEDYFINLCPTFQQISILSVDPAMPIGRRYKVTSESGLKYPWRNHHIYGQTFEPTQFTYDEMLGRVDDMYRRLYHVQGPSLMRVMQCNLNGYKYCVRSKHPRLREDKASFFKRRVGKAPILAVVAEFGPTPAIREQALALEREVHGLFGVPDAVEQAYREHLLRKAAAEFAHRGEGERPILTDSSRRYTYGPQSQMIQGRKPYVLTKTRLRDPEPSLTTV